MKKIFALLTVLSVALLLTLCVSAEAQHLWGEWSVLREPTCTEPGLRSRTCTIDPEFPHTEKETIPALGHIYSVEIREPTCTEPGSKTYTCSQCGEVKTEPHGQPLGHDYVLSLTDPTCTGDGAQTHTCTRCGDTYGETLPALGHDLRETDVQQPDCRHEGVRTFVCDRCGETHADVFAEKTEHRLLSEERQSGLYIYTVDRCVICGEETESVRTLDVIMVGNVALGSTDLFLLAFFLVLLIPDFFVLAWYRKRKKRVLAGRDRRN